MFLTRLAIHAPTDARTERAMQHAQMNALREQSDAAATIHRHAGTMMLTRAWNGRQARQGLETLCAITAARTGNAHQAECALQVQGNAPAAALTVSANPTGSGDLLFHAIRGRHARTGSALMNRALA